MKILSVLLLTLLSEVYSDSSVCDRYSDFEKLTHCGVDGYLLHFGKRNCQNFQDKATVERYDAAGKKFLTCTTNCLISYLDGIVKPPFPTCSNLQDEAFDSHVKCYLDCDFCKICKTNKYALSRSYFFKDFLSVTAISQAAQVAKACGLFGCFF